MLLGGVARASELCEEPSPPGKSPSVSVLNKISFFQNRKDEVPNQRLARGLAETKDKKGIREIAENLWNDNPSIQSDCLQVLYEIGYLDPKLIAGYAEDFLNLLHSKNNRLVWGSMTALSGVAPVWWTGDG
jgi:hypothetical protein